MSAPRITILVPTIGRTDYLPMTKMCISEQTRRDFRVIVLDNESPLEAAEFFEQWRREDPRVEISRADPRVPMFANFNRGMRAVTTEFVTFCHDDDEYAPDYLERLVGTLEAHPSAAFSGSNCDLIDEHGNIIEERRWIKKTELWSTARYVEELIGRGRNPVPMPGLVFRRSAFGPDGFDESLPIHFGDFVLLMRAAEDGGMVALKEPVVRIRRHSRQASAMALSESIPLRTELMLSYLDEYAMRHPNDAALVERMRRRVALSHRVAMLWGWFAASDCPERSACLDALSSTPLDRAARHILGWVDRRGLHPPPVGPRFKTVARTIARTLRF